MTIKISKTRFRSLLRLQGKLTGSKLLPTSGPKKSHSDACYPFYLYLYRTKTAEVEAIEKSDRICRAFMSKMSSIYIERTKDDVLDGQMPTKNELVVICEPSALQKRIYAHILTLPDYEMLQKAHSPCDCSINANFFQNYQRLGSKAERLDYYRKHKDDVVKRSKCCYDIPFNPRKGEPGQLDIDPDAVIWRTMDNHDGAEGCSNCPWCCLFPALSKL